MFRGYFNEYAVERKICLSLLHSSHSSEHLVYVLVHALVLNNINIFLYHNMFEI